MKLNNLGIDFAYMQYLNKQWYKIKLNYAQFSIIIFSNNWCETTTGSIATFFPDFLTVNPKASFPATPLREAPCL